MVNRGHPYAERMTGPWLGFPSLVAGHGRAALLTPDGELLELTANETARALLGLPPPLVVHAPASFRRLGFAPAAAYDLLELFAFVCPARLVVPTPRNLAAALDLDPPGAGLDAQAAALPEIASALLGRLAAGRGLAMNQDAAVLAATMGRAGWMWAASVTEALGARNARPDPASLRVWKRLPQWEDAPPPPPPSAHPVTESEARSALARILGADAEQRPGQADYAAAATAAFAPRTERGDPQMVLAEAGTGTGKTLGYVAPASLWARRNGGAVWISTFTRHLQRQIDAELGRLFPDPAERRRRVVIRKGRENYVCLLNFEDAAASGMDRVLLGLIARWAPATADGDIQGDLPGWMAELFGQPNLMALADRRGECIHGGCAHYRRCYVEHTIRRARTAELVIGNHALVMAQAAWGGLDDAQVPTRYVFDEGHHVFDAADGAFASVLSGAETAELRRWLLGAEGGRSRARGLRARIDDLMAGHPELSEPLDSVLKAARALPPQGWSHRLSDDGAPPPGEGNPTEAVLRVLRRQVAARQPGEGTLAPHALECDLFPVDDALPQAAVRLRRALAVLARSAETLRTLLSDRLESEEELDEALRSRIEGLCRSLGRRVLDNLAAWMAMLDAVSAVRPPGVSPTHIDLIRLDRRADGDRDVGLHRHWLDPTVPFAAVLAAPAHGLLVTSATLRDAGDPDLEASWLSAEHRVGAPHLPSPAIRATVASPFDYAAQTRAFVVTDVAAEIGPLAAAFRTLFVASGGGALGLFTAIARLRAVHDRIAPALESAGIPLLAQHVDPMDNATLVDIFRAEEASCLLGTDAMRDGVDVPGRSLRLVVFERVPWPRPDILHRERRIHLSGGEPALYDDRIARLRLRQAFGRLIRRATDRGVFVLLDRRTPSRLLTAFPVDARRVGLAQAAAETASFLRPQG